MKKILMLLVLFSCSEDDSPVFKIEGGLFLESRFEKFVEVAKYHNHTMPKDNMVLRFVNSERDCVNSSKSYIQDGQLYIDLDEVFIRDCTFMKSDYVEMIIFQELAHALFGTPFRDCGIMKKINTQDDFPVSPSWDYGDYPVLFDSEAPC